MADDGDDTGPTFQWVSAEPLPDGAPEHQPAKFVKEAGKAKVVYPNGDTFEGSYNDDKAKHGHGVYTWTKEVADGAAKNAWNPLNAEGDASAIPEDRTVRYEGGYKDGHKHGIGRITYPNGDVYHGSWAGGKPHGNGTYYYANGDLYSGSWHEGHKHGKGAFVFKADDSQLVGDWARGSIVTGKWVWADGTSWHGSFRNSRPYGRGVFYFPNGNMQEGEYVVERKATDDDDGADEASSKNLVWRGGPVVPGTADAFDLLAPPMDSGDSGAAAAAAAAGASK